MFDKQTTKIDLSNGKFIKISHDGQEPYGNKYIHKEGIRISTLKKYNEGITCPVVRINGCDYPFDCIKSPVTWTPDDDGLEAAIEDIEEWLGL